MRKSTFTVKTSRRIETIDITREVGEAVSGVTDGICVVYTPHTTTAIAKS